MRYGKPNKDGLCTGALETNEDALQVIKHMKRIIPKDKPTPKTKKVKAWALVDPDPEAKHPLWSVDETKALVQSDKNKLTTGLGRRLFINHKVLPVTIHYTLQTPKK